MTRADTIAGCILAGGRARRLGGGDKTLRDLDGRPILAHVIERLAPQVCGLVLNANGDAARFATFELPVAADAHEDFAGPLAGILAGLEWAHKAMPGATHLATVSGDAPFIPLDLVARLRAAIAGSHDTIAVAATGTQIHPVMGLWPLAIAPGLNRDLKDGARAVSEWCRQRGAIEVAFAPVDVWGRTVDPFFNANTPLELAQARLIAQRQEFRSPVIGIAGWKNAGKTTLTTRLIAELTARGKRISTIKFSHHDLDEISAAVPERLTDTYRQAGAGAHQVAFAGPSRWAIVEGGTSFIEWQQCRDSRHETLAAIIGALTPVDLILVEGYKTARIPKIEVRRTESCREGNLAEIDSYIFAIAAGYPIAASGHLSVGIDDVAVLASEIERIAGI